MVEVYKFGGTCVDSSQKLDRITELIISCSESLIVTLSAASGVTNQIKELLEGALNEQTIKNGIQILRNQHMELVKGRFQLPDSIDSNLKRLERLLYGIYYTEELTDRTYDLALTFGERFIAPILALFIEEKGFTAEIKNPEDIIITNGQHHSSLILLEDTEKKLKSNIMTDIKQDHILIVPGFFGVSKSGVVTTLGRSGTDYTASALAYGVDANSITIWKDVMGFMSADPKLVKNAHTIPNLSYQEAAELAYFGAKLLHPRAASPARIKRIPIYIRHIDDLKAITCINSEPSQTGNIIKSVSHMSNLVTVKVYASIGGNTKGALAEIAKKIAESGGNTISIATSQTCIAFLLQGLNVEKISENILSLGPNLVDEVEINEDISLICVVGEGLGSTPGIASKVFEAVSSQGINVQLISAGASTTAYHFTVKETDLAPALSVIHTFFFEEEI